MHMLKLKTHYMFEAVAGKENLGYDRNIECFVVRLVLRSDRIQSTCHFVNSYVHPVSPSSSPRWS